jgi:RNA polymerase sigma-70 factor (ECF subfamily)
MSKNDIIKDFNSIYTANYRRAFMLVKRYVQDNSVAEDIVSDVMIKLWQTMKTSEIDSEEALLYTMLRNSSLNYLKHQQIEMEALENVSDHLQWELQFRISTMEDASCDLATLNEINNLVQVTLSQLPELTRRIFKMSRYDNKTNKEIAELLNLSQKAVEYHITKSLHELRAGLKDYLPVNLWPIILFFI